MYMVFLNQHILLNPFHYKVSEHAHRYYTNHSENDNRAQNGVDKGVVVCCLGRDLGKLFDVFVRGVELLHGQHGRQNMEKLMTLSKEVERAWPQLLGKVARKEKHAQKQKDPHTSVM
jgi:hypothetical protein